ncbi:kinase-like protein [Streptomyces mobaraensis]|uniref:kinase-like protein n=1 Tax=Streptomyces mobaraensis TaxID=35621 RepID=UPI0033FC3B6B
MTPTAARTHDDVVQEIRDWSTRPPGAGIGAALAFLLSDRAQTALHALRTLGDERFDAVAAHHREAVDAHLGPVLLRIAEGRPVGEEAFRALAAATRDDPLQAVFAPARNPVPPEAVALERIRLLRRVWEPFAAWWNGYFTDAEPSVADLWRLYLPFARWIVREKRIRRSGELFVVGFNGSPGAGKTVLTNALAVVLDHLLDRGSEGRAVARSGDDWYLGRAAREPLRRLGYDPGVPGVPNRSLPGTHDLGRLLADLRAMERSTEHGTLRLRGFDKRNDDRSTDPDRCLEVRGRVGVFLFDLWFAGAETDVDPAALPDGLPRRVAEHLRGWRPVFDRMDALWAFDWPPFEQMVREREAQERLAERRDGGRGMDGEQIRAFMRYMTERSWDRRTTSPVPPDAAITFRAWRDTRHRVIAVRRGGRA